MIINVGYMICLKMSLIKLAINLKKPKLDTCKTCDTLITQIKQCKDNEQQALLQKEHQTHKELTDFSYMQKRR